MIRFKKKLQDLKIIIRRWVNDNRMHLSGSKREIVTELGMIDKARDRGVVADNCILRRLELNRQLHNINEVEAKDSIQKAKLNGRLRGSQLAIHGVFADGLWCTDPGKVKETFCNHFEARFKKPVTHRFKLNFHFHKKLLQGQAADLERWFGDKPLSVNFPRLFDLELNKGVSVAVKMDTSVNHSFRRSVRDGLEKQLLIELSTLLESVSLSNSQDRWVCDLTGDGEFRIKRFENSRVHTSKSGESWTSCTATALDAQVKGDFCWDLTRLKHRDIFVRAAEDYLNHVTTATGGIVQTLVNGVIDELDDSNEAYVVDKNVDEESLKTHLDDTNEPETAQESLEIVPESYAEVGSNQGNASIEGVSCSSISVPFIQTVEESLKIEVDETNEIRTTLESNGEFQDVPGNAVLIKEVFLASNWMNKPPSRAITNPCHCPKRCRNVMIALPIKDEVEDLEKAGVTVNQIDEAALRVGLPLRKAEHAFYLDWVVHSFKATNVGVADTTQRKIMKCRSSEPWNEDPRDEDTILGTILVEQQQDKSSSKKYESMGTIDFGANVNQVKSKAGVNNERKPERREQGWCLRSFYWWKVESK
ncbi:cobalamine-independent methionine synthase [Artemisia annua]|uniref:Cobalamine-independent methionine synthase n=1 Tax=Artemisia annua TaxID=35608 RepID=A0A2U1MBB3_ARTAN|nr:cobalamine-independent methionine synthase [Artemisia annua]